MMIARPIVAGPVAGAILGDVATGLALGVVFELFQYDILPLGAARYPEYGPATVAAVSAGEAGAGTFGLGFGVLVGLSTGLVGGVSLHLVHRLNAGAVEAAVPALEAGDPRVLVRLHVAGIVRDAARAALVTGGGLVLAQLVRVFLAGAYTLRGVAGGPLPRGGGGRPPGAPPPPAPRRGGGAPPPRARRGAALCARLVSVGARLVWRGWLPCTTGLAIAGVALGLDLRAVGAFLVVYNLGHVALRWWALRAGWAHGLSVGAALHQPLLQRAAAWSGPAMALAVGFALPLAARYLAAPFPAGARVVLARLAALGTALSL